MIGLLVGILTVLSAGAQQDTLKYRICLKDKAATEYSLQRPEEFLSAKALERRHRQGLEVDSTDLPVCRSYVDEIQRQGVNIVVTGKWENFVTVSCNDSSAIGRIAALPFVRSAERVWMRPAKEVVTPQRDSLVNRPEKHPESYYGAGAAQIQLSRGDKLHEAGFRGQGMTIAVIDAGYHNADRITAFDMNRVLGVKDFVNPRADIFAEQSHGMAVWSCMGLNRPEVMVGTAPEASYWLLRSEDTAPEASYWLLRSEDDYSENLVEQDYWSAAVEFADSVGVDVINTSLGYYTFDDPSKNYEFRQLDGRYALMSRQASHVADKGMVLVCSAGNAGAGPWKKITPPADADNVLTVGAVGKDGVLATFSSIGNTADGRIKPDVVWWPWATRPT